MLETLYVNYDVTHPSSFVYEDEGTHDWWLIIQTTTPAEFLIHDQFVCVGPYHAAIYPPYSKISYRAFGEEPYGNHWIRFYTNNPFVIKTTLPFCVPFPVADADYTRELFRLLSIENFFQDSLRNNNMEYLYQLLFNKYLASFTQEHKPLPTHNLLRIRQEIALKPNLPWTIDSIAHDLNMSSGHFHTLYRKAFGTTCGSDIIHFRVSLAKEHLSSTGFSIKEIAGLCGYQNTEHFSRQFKKQTGCSPQDYREQYLLDKK